jgi:nicotinamidase-related amidase
MRALATCLLAWTIAVVAIPVLAQNPQAPPPKQMRPALLVIDVQNDFLPMMAEADLKTAPMTINAAIWYFRQRGFPVIRIYHTDPQWGPVVDSAGFQFDPNIAVRDDDTRVIKNFPSAFKKTDLAKVLEEKGCNTVFLCGLSATGCVLATYHGAIDRDYDAFMIKGGLISPNATETAVIEDISETVTFEGLRAMLDNAKL